MIKISRKADYAVLIMADLAHRTRRHDGEDKMAPVSAPEIADSTNLSRAVVANLLKALTRAGLLESVRGAGGGYRLAMPMASINLAQILAAVEGPMRLVDCATLDTGSANDLPDCSLSDGCPSRSAMRVVHDRVSRLMEEIQLPELLKLENRGRQTVAIPDQE